MLLNRLFYFFELILLIPVFPLLYFHGKKLRQKISRLPAHSEYLALNNHPKGKNILVIGESTAAGVGASSPNMTFSYQLSGLLPENFNVYNLGKNGLKADRLKRLLLHGKQEIPPQIHTAIILIGANDCFKFTPPHKFGKEIRSFTEMIYSSYGVKKTVISNIPPVHQFPTLPALIRFFLGWHRSMLVREIQHLAKKQDWLYFRSAYVGYQKDFFASDGIHPSDLGYRLMAEDAIKAI